MSAWIRCGSCSVCKCAMESPDGEPNAEKARPRSRKLRRTGHHHRKDWRVIPDGPESEARDWHDVARVRSYPVMHGDPDNLPRAMSRALRGW